MSSGWVGALTGAAGTVAASPYLARLVVAVPDEQVRRWWAGARAPRGVVAASAGVALVLGALSGKAAGWSALLPAFLALALFGTPLVIIDLRVHRLPNRLVFGAAVAAAALLTLAAAEQDAWSNLVRALEGALAVYVVLFLLAFISPRSFGFGDVKLGAVVGAYLGWFSWLTVFYGIFAGFLLGALLSIVLLASRRATLKTAVAFGPMLVLGPLIVMAFNLVPRKG